MDYDDEYIHLTLPSGFLFHDRANYCTWNFMRGDSLIVVQVPAHEYVLGVERSIRSSKTTSGPHELTLRDRPGVYIECVKNIRGQFCNKQLQVVLHHAEFSAIVIISSTSPFQVSDIASFLESINVSVKDIEANRDTFVPSRKMKSRRQGDVKPFSQLPPELVYLQPAIDELAEIAPEEMANPSDFETLEQVVRQRVGGLPREEARRLLDEDHRALEAWHSRDPSGRMAAYAILGFMDSFILYGFGRGAGKGDT